MCYGWYEYLLKCMQCGSTYGSRYNVRKCALEKSQKSCSRPGAPGGRLKVTKIEDDVKLDWACENCKHNGKGGSTGQTNSRVKPLVWNNQINNWSSTW
ncbi:hypothetical protein MCOR25_001541 [Pyricularia grisea]|uniref:Uncharacterized protein n=1 Tax=Pyricularia grisea TaxID=148305 RepID=A0A6P8BKI2_PYRGI|nr:uncharacterized protein PgNI_01039 [Pyricularia grisea]KAI6380604.1 hypothetical protein MCOR25_001541 [Pyricularia grisea]TLD17406.1 hypothetical protein PgNI_01039 [Pyricularia grisea]